MFILDCVYHFFWTIAVLNLAVFFSLNNCVSCCSGVTLFLSVSFVLAGFKVNNYDIQLKKNSDSFEQKKPLLQRLFVATQYEYFAVEEAQETC